MRSVLIIGMSILGRHLAHKMREMGNSVMIVDKDEEVIQQLEAGETPEKEIYMDESWFAAEDIVSSITVDGTEMPIIHVTQEVLDARPY